MYIPVPMSCDGKQTVFFFICSSIKFLNLPLPSKSLEQIKIHVIYFIFLKVSWGVLI